MAVAHPPSAGVPARREALIAGGIVVVAIAIALLLFQGDRMYADSLMDLYSGRYVWRHGLPYTDPFTAAGAGRAWIDSQWLANLIFYAASAIGGLWLVGKLAVLGCVAAYLALSRLVRHLGGSFALQTLGPLAAFAVTLQSLFPRAQNLVLVLFVCLLRLVLDASRATELSRRRAAATLAGVVGLLVLWGNLHGSSAMAVALTTALALERTLRLVRAPASQRFARALWGGLLVLAPLTLLATPYGTAAYAEYRAVLANGAFHRYVSEWQPVWHPDGLVIGAPSLLLVLVALVALVRRRARLRGPLPACVAILTVATIAEARYCVWLGIAVVVLLADSTPSQARGLPSARLQLVLGAVALLGIAVIGVESADTGDARALGLMPRATVQAGYTRAQARPAAHVLGDLDSSALMLWLHPDMDGRVEFAPRLEVFRPADLTWWYRFQRGSTTAWLPPPAADDVLLGSRAWSPVLVARLARPRAGWTRERTVDGVALVRTP